MPRTRIRLALTALLCMGVFPLYGQHLSSSRFIGLGGATAFTDDPSALDWNPAGLSLVHFWSLAGTSFLTTAGAQTSGTFSLVGAAAQVGDGHAVAARVSPGMTLDFVVPATFAVADSSTQLVARFDKEITYTERFAAGYAYRVDDRLAAGLAVHLFGENVKDVRYALDSNSVLVSTTVESQASSLVGDVGVRWEPEPAWVIGAVAKNAFTLAKSELPEDVAAYRLDRNAYGRLGVGYTGFRRTLVGIDVDTERRLRAGGEYMLTDNLRAQAGIAADASDGLTAEAASAGVSLSVEQFIISASYLGFFQRGSRSGTADLEAFLASPAHEIEYNTYTPDRLSLSVSMRLGATVVSMAKIEYASIAGNIYPAERTNYALNPLGTARVRNVAGKPISVRLRFRVDGFMDAPTETPPEAIDSGAVADIPVYALFGDNLARNGELSVREGVIEVRTTTSGDAEDRYPLKILVHGRNDWNGDARMLRYFARSDDDSVIAFTRRVLAAHKGVLDTLPAQLVSLYKARVLFDSLAARLTYVADPEQSDDYVQYPGETLRLRGGDCDDMSVCYASLLSSVGIRTAFVDVVPPDKPDSAHIYMVFDTGIDAAQAQLVSDNPKRFVLRSGGGGTAQAGPTTAWIPLETTVVRSGFDAAWNAGAEEYFSEVELKLGLAKGWIRLVDLASMN